MTFEKALKTISDGTLRRTKTRETILQAIFKCKSPFSASDVLAHLPKKGKSRTVDLVTIYRNLPIFEEAGVICRADFSDDMARYMISEEGHDHHHHHIICRECHQIEPVDFCIIDAQVQILGKLGFKDVHHRLEFTGICPGCAS